MKSSASPALARAAAESRQVFPEVTPFPYCQVSRAASAPENTPAAVPAGAQAPVPAPEVDSAAQEIQMREAGRQQGERESRARFEEQLNRERSVMAQAIKDFAGERSAYYRKVEAEVVQLALAIARKVLHREAQVDPWLLLGAVRVAMEKMEGASGVALAVHPQRAAEWRKNLASQNNPGIIPEIVEDAALALDQVQLRTSMGTAELGLEVQFKEIEQGLMDLLAARPGATQ